MDRVDESIRQSEYTAWRDCRRKWKFQYGTPVELTTPDEPPPMRKYNKSDIGTAAHGGFAAVHLGEGDPVSATFEAAEQAYEEARNERTDEQAISFDEFWCERSLERAHSAVHHYEDWLAEGHDVGVKYLQVEMPFEEGDMHGTIDCVMDHPIHGLTILDMKTVDQFGPPQQADFQLRSYALAYYKRTGLVPQTVMHRQVKRVFYGGTAKGPFVQEFPIHMNEDILRAHQAHLDVQTEEIRHARTLDVEDPHLYPNTGKQCSYMCDYQGECGGMDLG